MGISPQNMACKMVLTYLHFRVLKIQLIHYPLVNCPIAMEHHHCLAGKIHYFYGHFFKFANCLFTRGYRWCSISICRGHVRIVRIALRNQAGGQGQYGLDHGSFDVHVDHVNGNFRIRLIGGTDSIYKAYFLGLCKGISPQNMALYGTVPPF